MVRFRLSIGGITILNITEAALQSGTLFLLYYIVRPESFGGGSPFGQFDSWHIELHPTILMMAAVTFVALAASALLSFWHARWIILLWRKYQIHAINVLLFEIQKACQRGTLDEATIKAPPVPALLRQSERLGMLVRLVVNTIATSIRFLAFATFAIIVNPFLTLVLFIATIPSGGLAMFYFARQASRSVRTAESLAPGASREVANQLHAAAAGKLKPFHDSETSRFVMKLRAQIQALVWMETARFGTTLIVVVMLVGLILSAGYGGWHSQDSMSQILIYVIALLLAFRQLIALTTTISGIGRFYPALVRYRILLNLVRTADSPQDFQKRLKRELPTHAVESEDVEETF